MHKYHTTHIGLFQKMMAIGPSFSVQNGPLISTSLLGVSNCIKSRGHTSRTFKHMFLDYLYPYVRRMRLSDYEVMPSSVVENYAFHLATLWNGEEEKESINNVRKAFLTACMKCGVDIEGGFFYIGTKSDFYNNYRSEYKDLLYYKRLSINEYIEKVRRSFVVFNCPAVAGCLGWKLAEYLMLGKAIISMPINHPMPGGGLKHGVHFHLVRSVDEIPEAICQIKDDKEYRIWLENNARSYFEEYLAPKIVLSRIIDQCIVNKR